MIAIMKKELRAYFTQMIGYNVLVLMVLLTGLFFALLNVMPRSPNFHIVLSNFLVFLILVVPIITMRLFAEESRNRTDQLLFTSPLTVTQIVLGKYLAASLLFSAAMGVTMLFPLMLSQYGELPTNQIIGAYVGFILMGMALIALGLFISVMTDNQITAAVFTFGAVFVVFLMDAIAGAMPTDTISSLVFVALLVLAVAGIWYNSTKHIKSAIILAAAGIVVIVALYFFNNLIFDGVIVRFLRWISLFSRYHNLTRGVLNLSDIVYYVTFGMMFIYFTINVIEKRRWR